MEQFAVTSVSSKGQVVIPNDIRKKLGISTGTKLIVVTDGQNLLLKPIKTPRLKTFEDLIRKTREIIAQSGIKEKDLKRIIRADRQSNTKK